MKVTVFLAIICGFSIAGCHCGSKQQKSVFNPGFDGPPTIVYKMKSDYSKNVPVILSESKSGIVSYPAIEDISINGTFPLPTILKNGYYLDNRGIGPNVAFLKYSYQEYAKLTKTPDASELMQAITDKDPLIVMYNCGNRLGFTNIEKELNQLIESGDIEKKCKKLK